MTRRARSPRLTAVRACRPTAASRSVTASTTTATAQIDDVAPGQASSAIRNNCGACGNECKFPHAFGQCVGGFDGGVPTCKENGCQPGYVDLDGDPTNGCEYVCTPTTPPTEICDGKDNNCDGQVDEGFTTDLVRRGAPACRSTTSCSPTAASAAPSATSAPARSWRARAPAPADAVSAPSSAASTASTPTACTQTYRHNPAAGPITTTGCEYHCPKPAIDDGQRLQPERRVHLPGRDLQRHRRRLQLRRRRQPDATPASISRAPTARRASCAADDAATHLRQGSRASAGTLICIERRRDVRAARSDRRPRSAQPASTPSTMTATARSTSRSPPTWQDAGHQMPRYDSDPDQLRRLRRRPKPARGGRRQHVLAASRAGRDHAGSCSVVACKPSFDYVGKTGTGNACNHDPRAGPEDSHNGPPTVTGVGCYYSCTPTRAARSATARTTTATAASTTA